MVLGPTIETIGNLVENRMDLGFGDVKQMHTDFTCLAVCSNAMIC